MGVGGALVASGPAALVVIGVGGPIVVGGGVVVEFCGCAGAFDGVAAGAVVCIPPEAAAGAGVAVVGVVVGGGCGVGVVVRDRWAVAQLAQVRISPKVRRRTVMGVIPWNKMPQWCSLRSNFLQVSD